ncbi:geranylgeranyl reductase family protein [Rhabdothermincola salaria]|uniref:geranylgeranyl reductase family protein n=1 Tax=Rhabdothermincola salaria TaxID=2903142 RepID=UPI001E36E608|nr:geranylgeranyl reductase family protein [Rhabdothermincola salaria]MCD9623675.1 geranylgeranyl reductase family protein [Rhabdothermincola salaria]
MERCDVAVIGAGPAGSAAATWAARGGADVMLFEKGERGRDKSCGDGLTPRAVAELDRMGVDIGTFHRIDGLRVQAGRTVREVDWPDGPFPPRGAVAPRAEFDALLMETAAKAGADLRERSVAEPVLDGERVVGVRTKHGEVRADLVVVASGAGSPAAKALGAVRVPTSPFGLAIRAYVPSTRADDRYMEACLTVQGPDGDIVPGYGWVFPAGDGVVNVGVGALSTMRNFSDLNLNRMLDAYTAQVRESWGLGEVLARPRAWRLPMHVGRRHGPGWVAIGDAAGLVNPFNGEGIDYGLESGRLAAECHQASPHHADALYGARLEAEYDAFFATARRFAWVIGRPQLLRVLLAMALSTGFTMRLVLDIMANLVDEEHPGLAGRSLSIGGRGLALLDPVLRS